MNLATIARRDKRFDNNISIKYIKYDKEDEIEVYVIKKAKSLNKSLDYIEIPIYIDGNLEYCRYRSIDEFLNRNIANEAKIQGVDEWLVRCKKCKHCRLSKKDADDVYCTLKSCKFKP
jgi:hypothetical protein